MGRKRTRTGEAEEAGDGRHVDSHDTQDPATEAIEAWDAVCLDEVCTKPTPCPSLGWLRFGVTALDSSSCAKLSWASRHMRSAIRDAAAVRVVLGLGQGCIKNDLASNRLANPVLALSHLESLAHAPFLFQSLRGLLRLVVESAQVDSTAILLEAPSAGGRLCELVCEQVLDLDEHRQDDDGTRLQASTVARLASLMYQYAPPKDYAMALEGMLGRIMTTESPDGKKQHRKIAATQIIERGGAAAQLVHGLPNLLPATRTFKSLASKRKQVLATKLICQLVERLTFPAAEASIILQLSFPIDRAVGHEILQGQTGPFMHSLRVLESEVWNPDKLDKALDVLVIHAKRYYILVFESEMSCEQNQATA